MAKLTRNDFIKKFQEETLKVGMELTKADALTLIKAYEATVEGAILSAEAEGYDSFGVGFGTVKIVDVAERSGVSKLGGVDKPWTTPAHKTARFKLAGGIKEALK